MNLEPRNSMTLFLGGFILIFTLCNYQPAEGQSLDTIDVTPADPTINVGQTELFTATGIFGDGSSRILTAIPIAAGGSHTCALLPDGTVQCWGDNYYGQLGDGTNTNSSSPVAVTGIGNATAVTTGYGHTCALLPGGTVNCWGWNFAGQLGNGTTTSSPTPGPVLGISNATAVAAGFGHTCALLADGSIQCWGYNSGEDLGNGSRMNSSIPLAVSGISNATAIAAGSYFTCALNSDGSIQCWGENTEGQLGNVTTTNSSVPVLVRGITDATAVSAENAHACALLTDKSIKCWGWNMYGQLGNGSTKNSSVPLKVGGITNATAVGAGGAHTCALLTDGTIQCWGANYSGQLGDGNITDTSYPGAVFGIINAKSISAGASHTCAVISDGSVQCWGGNFYGQLGEITPSVYSPVPLRAGGASFMVSPILWSSSDTAVAAINSTGMVIGLSPGTTTISATGAGISGNTTLTIVDPHLPDLTLLAAATMTTVIAPGKNISVLNTVHNQGTVTAGSSLVAFHLSTNNIYGDGDDIAFTSTRILGSLAAQASSPSSTALTVPGTTPEGIYYICAKADDTDTVSESNETNNTRCTYTMIQVTRADLIETSVMPNSATAIQAGTLSVSNTVSNLGLVSSGAFRIAYHLSFNTTYGDGDDIVISTIRAVTTLGPGASNTAITSLSIPSNAPGGTYHVCVMADSLNQVDEGGNEGNNTLCSTNTVTLPTADLLMTAVSTATTAIAPGKTLSVSNTVMNQGGYGAGSFRIGFYLSVNSDGSTNDVAITATRTLSSLGAGTTSTGSTTLTIPSGAPLGTYYVCAMADSLNQVPEMDEGNNVLCTGGTIQVTLPDLSMTDVTPNAATANKGGTLSVTTTVSNAGSASGAFRIAFHLSTDTTYGNGDDVVITITRSVTSLAAGASSTGTTSLTIPGATASGNYYVCTLADSLSQVAETDEGNNTLCSDDTVTVQ
jgi:alpha-tubulin suppressor-like RCC1 family protein/subtilase family serine protease